MGYSFRSLALSKIAGKIDMAKLGHVDTRQNHLGGLVSDSRLKRKNIKKYKKGDDGEKISIYALSVELVRGFL